jgi:hypothetical protein
MPHIKVYVNSERYPLPSAGNTIRLVAPLSAQQTHFPSQRRLWPEPEAQRAKHNRGSALPQETGGLRLQSYEREIPDFSAQANPSGKFVLVRWREKASTGADATRAFICAKGAR